MAHNKADDPENHPKQDKSRSSADVSPPDLEAMLRMWVSWMEATNQRFRVSGRRSGNRSCPTWPVA